MNRQAKHLYVFGPFLFDPEERLLMRDGKPVSLGPKVVETLFLLVQNAGHLVDKDELMKRVWPDTFVEEGNLNKNIFILRKTLGQWDGGLEYIETVPKRGYRFVAPVNQVSEVEARPQSQPDPLPGAYLIGKKVSHYRVLELLGGGGMGLVYKAEDLKLGRRVALKFLPEELASDPVALQRFEREARAASALNHPNICTIYAIEEHDQQPFIAMELLEGETLRELISSASSRASCDPRELLQLDKLRDVAIQVTEGLDAAHRKGIIHRDIKPANIFLTTRGQAKILDFGLAKLQESEISDERTATEHKPNRESDLHLTRTGVTIGTAGYMSPEQVRGEKLDTRTDLFNFGLVLYEMAAGQRAFTGETAPLLREAILKHTPASAKELNTEIPAGLEAIINKALEKDRALRYQSAAEMRTNLEKLRPAVRLRRFGVGRSAFASVVVAFLVFIGAAMWFTRSHPSSEVRVLSPLELKQRQLTANSSENGVTGGAISPDGKSLAYADLRGIHIQSIDTGEVRDVPEPGSLRGLQVDWTIVPTWFRDSTRFLANAIPHGRSPSIWGVSVNGGPPQKLRDDAFAWTLSRDSSWVAFGANLSKLYYHEMWLMRPDGEKAHKLYEADENNAFLGAEWSPDGQRLAYVNLYQGEDTNRLTIESRDLKGGPPITAVSLPYGLADWTWSPDGRIITSFPDGDDPRAGTCNFWQTRVDLHTGKPLEKPDRLTAWSGFCMDQLSASADGMRLTFRRSSSQSVIYIADLQGNGNRMSTPRRLTLTEGRSYPAGWTPDSNAVVFASDHIGQRGIFKQSLDKDTAEAVATALADRLPLPWGGGLIEKEVPRVSPDGAWVLHLILPLKNGSSSPVRLVRIPIAGGPPQLVLTTSLGAAQSLGCARSPSTLCVIAELSVDRKQLIFTAFDVIKGRGREVARFATQPTPDAEYAWDLSPDGNRIAILRRSEGTIHLLSLGSQASREIPVKYWSDFQSVDWAADGKTLFVSAITKTGSALLQVDSRANAHLLWKAKANVRPVSTPFMGGPSTPWAMPSPDGRHLAICVWSTTANVWMMENF